MNILILNWKDIKNPEVGGAEIIAFEFAKKLAKDGHSVSFFSRIFPGALPEEVVDNVKIVRRGDVLSVYLQAYFYYKSLKKKPDIVLDMVNTICWQTPLYVPKKNRIFYLNQLAKEVWFYEKKYPISWIGYFLERVQYFTYKQTKVVCYSESTKKDLIAFGIPADNIHLFSLGLDHSRYKPSSKKSKTPLFLFVARLVKMKRADLCIKAMRLFLRKNAQGKLFIVGNGPDEIRLQTLIKKYKLGKNVFIINSNNFFFKKDNRDIKVKLMQEAWALLLPSVKEGWGMVVTEAAACGTPSIVSDVTGLRDSVVRDKTGIILAKDPSVNTLAKAMMKISQDKHLRQELSEGALEWSKHFSWEKSYQDIKQIIFNK